MKNNSNLSILTKGILKENPVFEFVVSFLDEHPELIQGKSAKEIFGLISGAFKNSKKQ